ncbi:DnaJ C-terminal domain-containing protein [Asticcacaulis sp.]|uniref:DnaJ C-terminal domain-containing protein n=1 Tax=Asticcacaulis sp. TaxID=1872648 RepID=UPI002C04F110|nr:DnaJ C-terminal domain-containing protein [Asticcacaulis sp.]HTM82044.1 DnaJ C-terminal domain-containing protein [Asticcacaulis sp.]
MAGLKSHAAALAELGLSETASDEDIRKAFRQRLKRAHPDLNGGADTRLRRLILARDLLMSKRKSEQEAFEFIHAAFDDSSTPLIITLQQALFGGTAMAEVPALEFSHAEETLTSLTQTKTLCVALPCGLRDGEKVRLPCEGAAFSEMFFHIHIEPETNCRVWGDDIWMTARLENRLFQRGGEAIIDTPHGPQEIKIDRDVPHGASLCLSGKGLPATETTPAGNLYIRLEACPDIVRPVVHVLSEFRQRWAS